MTIAMPYGLKVSSMFSSELCGIWILTGIKPGVGQIAEE